MKGIILAGGTGSRLAPLTTVTNKQLMPVYDKPVIYFPLSTLMLAGIRDILIIANPADQAKIETLLEDGRSLGLNIKYAVQWKPSGIPEAFDIGRKFIGHDNVCLILGDNMFYGNNLTERLVKAKQDIEKLGGANIFCYKVKSPEKFGVAVLDQDNKVVRVVEKPKEHISPYAITGLYMFDNSVIDKARRCVPSPRGETEIVDVIRAYQEAGSLKASTLMKGFYWGDLGTVDSLFKAANFVKLIQDSQNTSIACVEEIAYRLKYIDRTILRQHADKYRNSPYGQYLLDICNES